MNYDCSTRVGEVTRSRLVSVYKYSLIFIKNNMIVLHAVWINEWNFYTNTNTMVPQLTYISILNKTNENTCLGRLQYLPLIDYYIRYGKSHQLK